MMKQNKSAIFGVTLTTFWVTIFIILILLIFILISEVVKVGQTDKIRFDDKSMVSLKTYDDGLQNKMLFDFLVGCEGNFDGEKRNFREVIRLWNGNSEGVKDFVSLCKVPFLVLEKGEDKIWCDIEDCYVGEYYLIRNDSSKFEIDGVKIVVNNDFTELRKYQKEDEIYLYQYGQ